MIATHNIRDISFGHNSIKLVIDGTTIELMLEQVSQKLNDASDIQRKLYKISPSGYGIHWPLIDEDLSVDSILKLSRQK
jgi:translation elongation factor EF-1beta